jgi:hypothetical protein
MRAIVQALARAHYRKVDALVGTHNLGIALMLATVAPAAETATRLMNVRRVIVFSPP